jgi:formate hydrogenlyase subunit 4
MLNYCEFKNMFGKPNTGAHKYRFFNIAIIDVVLTIVLAYVISWFFEYPLLLTLGILFLLGILMHRFFCVRTTVDKFLFPNVDE